MARECSFGNAMANATASGLPHVGRLGSRSMTNCSGPENKSAKKANAAENLLDF
jgi:hypothetical protein